MIGYIYILSTPYDGLLKVGFTTRDVKTRAKELSSQTGVVGEFKLIKEFETPNSIIEVVEKQAHINLKKVNLHQEKEYFRASVTQCEIAIKKALAETRANELLETIKNEKSKKLKQEKAERKKLLNEIEEKNKALFSVFEKENNELMQSIKSNFNELNEIINQSQKITLMQSFFSKNDESNALRKRKNELKELLKMQRVDFLKAEDNFRKTQKLSFQKYKRMNNNPASSITQIYYRFDKILKVGW